MFVLNVVIVKEWRRMSRKDYEKIAFILGVEKASKRMIKHFCNMLQHDNQNFNEDMFRAYIQSYKNGVIYK